jgi:hypothetical protein
MVISRHERPHSWVQGNNVRRVFTRTNLPVGLILARVDLFQF